MSVNKSHLALDKKLTICIVNTHFQDTVGGSQLQCHIIAEELQKRGHSVTYVAIDGHSQVYNTPYTVIGVKRNGYRVGKIISGIKPDILYWRFNKKFFLKSVKTAAENVGRVVFAVSNIRDLQPYSAVLKKPFTFGSIRQFIQKNLVSRYNHFGFSYVDGLTVNNKNQLEMSPVSPSIYIPNAIYTKTAHFKWPRPYVLWVANIKDRKQPDVFVKAAANFMGKGIDFLMMGKLEDEKYNWLNNNEHVPANFHYLGTQHIDVVNGALKHSLFLATTSTPEGFSNNIIQAWFQQKPVVAFEFDPGGYINDHNLGFVSEGNMDQFMNHIEVMITNENLRKEVGRRAFKFANDHFSTEKTVNAIENLFFQIL